jgi:DinB family protein
MSFSVVEGVELLLSTPASLRALTAGVQRPALRFREDRSAWTIPEVVSHMTDAEIVDWMPRIDIILSDQSDKRFAPFDRTGGFKRYKGWSLADVLEEFDRLRRLNVEKLLSVRLRSESLERTGIHPDLGTVTLEQLIACWVTHDCAHLAQISRILTRYFGANIGPWKAYFSLLKSL